MTGNLALWGVETAAQQLAREMVRSVPITLASVALWDQPSFALTVRAVSASRPLPWPLPVGVRVALAEAPWYRFVFERHEPVFLEQAVPTEVTFQERADLSLVPNLRAIYLLPIRLGEETVGVLGLGEMRSPEREPFTEEKRQRCRAVLEEFLTASADAWEAGRLRRQIRAMASLLQIVKDMLDARTFQDILACLASEVADWLGTPVGGILLGARPRNGLTVLGRWQFPEPLAEEDGARLMLALARMRGDGQWPVNVVSVAEDPLDPLHRATQQGATWTRVGLPLMRGDRLLGVACLYVEDELRPAEWELEAFRRRGEIAAAGMEIVTILQAHRTEKESLWGTAYELLTTHQRAVLQEAFAGIGRLVAALLPARLEQSAAREAPGLVSIEGPGWSGLAEMIAREVTAILTEIGGTDEPVEEGGRTPLEINALVRHAVEIARAKWEDEPRRRGISVELNLEPWNEPLVTETSLALIGAVIYAIENAVEAMPEGGQIHVRTARDDGHVLISVGDTGPGVADELREEAFTPFFSTKGRPHLGLGLSVARSLLQRLGGHVHVAPAVDTGAIVTLRLPIRPSREETSSGADR